MAVENRKSLAFLQNSALFIRKRRSRQDVELILDADNLIHLSVPYPSRPSRRQQGGRWGEQPVARWAVPGYEDFSL